MEVTVTGATGFLGANLAIELIKNGYNVRGTRRKSSRVDHLDDFPIEWIDAELENEESLVEAFRDSDFVFHCAAKVSNRKNPDLEMVRSNVEGTTRVVNAVRRSGVSRFVHVSTVAAIAVTETGEPVRENQPWNLDKYGLDDGYTITKYKSEQIVRSAAKNDVNAVIVNPTFMIGPYDPKPSSGRLIINVVTGKLPGYTDGFNNFVDVRDVCKGIISACNKGRRGESYILGNTNLSYQEIYTLIAEAAGVKRTLRYIPRVLMSLVGRGGDLIEKLTGKEAPVNSKIVNYAYCKRYIFSSEKAKCELDYQPGSIKKAIRDAIGWFRDQGMLE